MTSKGSPSFEKPSAEPGGAKLLSTLMLGALAVAAVGLAIGFAPRLGARDALAKETRGQNIPIVNITQPITGAPGLSAPLAAEIQPFLEAGIYARATGYVKRRLVDIGDSVKTGQLLAELDTPELNQQLAQARAQQAQAEAALRLSKATAARWAELLKTSGVSEQEAAEKQADYELKQATLDSAKASVGQLEELKSFASVTAPFDGTITARFADDGQLITAAGRQLFSLAHVSPLRIFVRVPQTLAVSVKAGGKATLTLSELPGRKFDAKVVRTSGAIDPAARTLLVELQSDNAEGQILPGSYGQVQFTDSTVPTLTLAAATLLFRSDGVHVAVVNSKNQADVRSVKLGRDFGQTIEILDGVAPGDRVIINPPDSLADGTELWIAEPKEQAK